MKKENKIIKYSARTLGIGFSIFFYMVFVAIAPLIGNIVCGLIAISYVFYKFIKKEWSLSKLVSWYRRHNSLQKVVIGVLITIIVPFIGLFISSYSYGSIHREEIAEERRIKQEEQARIEQEKKELEERAEKDRLAKEQEEKEKAEQERVAQEKAEAEKKVAVTSTEEQTNIFDGYRKITVDGGNLSGHREPNVVVDIGFGDREYYAFTNEHGQLVKVIAKQIIPQDDSTEPVNSKGRYYNDEAKVPGVESEDLDEGHVIADSLGGVSNAYNITPQNSTLNRHGDQSYMEKNIRDAGGCTDFEAIITYPNTTTQIPSHYSYTYKINGRVVKDEFDNIDPDEYNTNNGITAPIEKPQPQPEVKPQPQPKPVAPKPEVGRTVYWIDGGSVYHTNINCPNLQKSKKEKHSGTIQQSGMSKCCGSKACK